jgi:hypothetical protein
MSELKAEPGNHVWRALRQAKRDAEYNATNHKRRIDSLASEIQRNSAGLDRSLAIVRAVESHAENQGWTLELESDKPPNVDLNQ